MKTHSELLFVLLFLQLVSCRNIKLVGKTVDNEYLLKQYVIDKTITAENLQYNLQTPIQINSLLYESKRNTQNNNKIETIVSFDLSNLKPALELTTCSTKKLIDINEFNQYPRDVLDLINITISKQSFYRPIFNFKLNNNSPTLNCSSYSYGLLDLQSNSQFKLYQEMLQRIVQTQTDEIGLDSNLLTSLIQDCDLTGQIYLSNNTKISYQFQYHSCNLNKQKNLTDIILPINKLENVQQIVFQILTPHTYVYTDTDIPTPQNNIQQLKSSQLKLRLEQNQLSQIFIQVQKRLFNRGFHRKYIFYFSIQDPLQKINKLLDNDQCDLIIIDYLVEELIFDRENNKELQQKQNTFVNTLELIDIEVPVQKEKAHIIAVKRRLQKSDIDSEEADHAIRGKIEIPVTVRYSLYAGEKDEQNFLMPPHSLAYLNCKTTGNILKSLFENVLISTPQKHILKLHGAPNAIKLQQYRFYENIKSFIPSQYILNKKVKSFVESVSIILPVILALILCFFMIKK